MNMSCRILAGLWAGVLKTALPHTKETVQLYQTDTSRSVGQFSLSYILTHHWAMTQKPYNWDAAYANGFPFWMRTTGNMSFGMWGDLIG
jgi:hypothetical protein